MQGTGDYMGPSCIRINEKMGGSKRVIGSDLIPLSVIARLHSISNSDPLVLLRIDAPHSNEG
jgi:hypothetical protein